MIWSGDFAFPGETKLRYLFLVVPVLLFSCSLSARVPTVSDHRLERLVREEAYRILMVTEDRDAAGKYRFLLSDFPRKDILGLSVGQRRIYVSYDLAKEAAKSSWGRWQLRQTLAHEIAHEISGHARGNASFNRSIQGLGVTGADVGLPATVRFHSYSLEKELEADLNGMKYWRDLRWNCRIWVKILEGFQERSYPGDILHPTGKRLKQALTACPAVRNPPLA
jgi:hypothetical protein